MASAASDGKIAEARKPAEVLIDGRSSVDVDEEVTRVELGRNGAGSATAATGCVCELSRAQLRMHARRRSDQDRRNLPAW